jgi:hypothetical protein
MTTTTTMKLRKYHDEILRHRLDADCTVECLLDYAEGEAPIAHSPEAAEAAVGEIYRMLDAGEIDFGCLSRLAVEVLVDCIEGSTFFADENQAIAMGEWTKARSRAAHAAADELEKWISEAAGRRVRCTRF